MADHYKTLGISNNASEEEIKKAYRKLAMEHHPDRHQGQKEKKEAEVKFKILKQAYEVLSDKNKKAAYDSRGSFSEGLNSRHFSGEEAENILRQMHEAHEHFKRNSVPNVRLFVNLAQAHTGTNIKINLFNKIVDYNLPGGLPNGVSFWAEVPFEGAQKKIHMHLVIDAGEFKFINEGSEDGIFFSGDLEKSIEIDALDILLGSWILVTDFLGKKLQVRVPSGFDLGHRLKVANHGYLHWRNNMPMERGDLYLKVVPKFKSIEKLDVDKITQLYNMVNKK